MPPDRGPETAERVANANIYLIYHETVGLLRAMHVQC